MAKDKNLVVEPDQDIAEEETEMATESQVQENDPLAEQAEVNSADPMQEGGIRSLGDVLGVEADKVVSKVVKPAQIEGLTIHVTGYKEMDGQNDSKYFFTYITNPKTGNEAGVSLGTSSVMSKLKAVKAQDAFPVSCKIIKLGRGWDIVSA